MPGDPNWSSVKLLAGWESGYIDESSNARTLSQSGVGFSRSTTRSKFGSYSFFTNSGGTASGCVTAVDSADWAFGSGAFTVEFWINWNSYSSSLNTYLVDQYTPTGNQRSWGIAQNANGANTICLVLSNAGTSATQIISGAFTPVTNTWYHICADFDGTTYRVYVDGVVKATSTTLTSIFDGSSVLSIGNQAGTSISADAYFDEVRITKGVARYHGAFTPPAAAFERGAASTPFTWSSINLTANFFGYAGYSASPAVGSISGQPVSGKTLIQFSSQSGSLTVKFSGNTTANALPDLYVGSTLIPFSGVTGSYDGTNTTYTLANAFAFTPGNTYKIATTYVAPVNISTLTDGFDDNSLDAAKWTKGSTSAYTQSNTLPGSINEMNGRIVATPSGAFQPAVIQTTNSYLFDTVYVSINPVDYYHSDAWIAVYPAQNPAGRAVWEIFNGEMYASYTTSNAGPGDLGPYDPSSYKWLRLRRSGNTIYFDFATSGASDPPASNQWLNAGSVTDTNLGNVAEWKVELGAASTDGNQITVEFDGFNTSTLAGTIYNETLSEGTTLGASQTTTMSLSVVRSEGVSVGAAQVNTATLLASVSQGVSLGDSNVNSLASGATIGEAISTGDGFTSSSALAAALAESVSLSEVLANNQSLVATLTETLVLGTMELATQAFSLGMSEGVLVGTVQVASTNQVSSFSEAVALSESLVTTAVMNESFSESFLASDLISSGSGPIYGHSLSEDVALATSFAAQVVFGPALVETTNLAVDIATQAVMGVSFIEPVIVGYLVVATQSMTASLAEAVSIAENLQADMSMQATISEGITPVDELRNGVAISLALQESFLLGSSYSGGLLFIEELNEGLALASALSAGLQYDLAISEGLVTNAVMVGGLVYVAELISTVHFKANYESFFTDNAIIIPADRTTEMLISDRVIVLDAEPRLIDIGGSYSGRVFEVSSED